MPDPIPYTNVLQARENLAFQLATVDTFLTLYNPTTGEYGGTEGQQFDWQTTVIRGCAQTTFIANINLACYPLGAFASFLTPGGF